MVLGVNIYLKVATLTVPQSIVMEMERKSSFAVRTYRIRLFLTFVQKSRNILVVLYL